MNLKEMPSECSIYGLHWELSPSPAIIFSANFCDNLLSIWLEMWTWPSPAPYRLREMLFQPS